MSRLLLVCLTLGMVALVGCGPKYPLGEVSGTVTISGKPGHNLYLEFVPDQAGDGPSSAAVTDDQGKFTLKLITKDGKGPMGALVGPHRVHLSDLKVARSATGRGVPIRLKKDYTTLSTTPLRFEVTDGPQTIDIAIP